MGLNDTLNLLLEKDKSGLNPVWNSIESRFAKGWNNVSEYFSVSSLFYCPRWAFLRRAGVPEKNALHSCFMMEVGTFLHGIIQDAMDESLKGYGFREHEFVNDKLSIKGHIDGAVPADGELIEIKTMGSNSVNKTLRTGIPDYYLGQANLYCYLWNRKYKRKLNMIRFIVVARDSMEPINLDPVPIDIELQKKTVTDLKKYCLMWSNGQLPKQGQKCGSCANQSICGKSNNLFDYLPGGKLRNE